MNSAHKTVLDQLEHVWKEHVRVDYFNGDLTYGEQSVHASIAHHLRNHMTKEPYFRVWHEVSINSIKAILKRDDFDDRRILDLVLAFADTEDLTEQGEYGLIPRDLSEVTNAELYAAIEVKYASYQLHKEEESTYEYIARLVGKIPKDDNLALLAYDIAKLVDIRNKYLPDMHPIFVYIPGTDQKKMDSWKSILSEKATKNKVSFFFGDPVNPDRKKWTVDFNQE